MKKKLIGAALLSALVIVGFVLYAQKQKTDQTSQDVSQRHSSSQPSVGTTKITATFNKQSLSKTDPASLWVVVNKQHSLQPQTYAPSDLTFPNIPLRVPGNETMQLRREASLALETMALAAKIENVHLMLSSGYRSYGYQVGLYKGYVSSQGQAVADTQSARPGFSEHQTGLAADLEPENRTCEVEDCFAQTNEGKWLAENSYKYGYILRYGSNDQALTGYKQESWHFRYVGVALSVELHKTGVTTLEQFFSVPGGTTYAN